VSIGRCPCLEVQYTSAPNIWEEIEHEEVPNMTRLARRVEQYARFVEAVRWSCGRRFVRTFSKAENKPKVTTQSCSLSPSYRKKLVLNYNQEPENRETTSPLPGRRTNLRTAIFTHMERHNSFPDDARMAGKNIGAAIRHVVFSHFETSLD
jgi:hypothetical protein